MNGRRALALFPLGAMLVAGCSSFGERPPSEDTVPSVLVEGMVLQVDDGARRVAVEASRAEFEGLPGRSPGELWGVQVRQGDGRGRVEARARHATIDAGGQLVLEGAEAEMGSARLRADTLRADTCHGTISGRGVRASFDVSSSPPDGSPDDSSNR